MLLGESIPIYGGILGHVKGNFKIDGTNGRLVVLACQGRIRDASGGYGGGMRGRGSLPDKGGDEKQRPGAFPEDPLVVNKIQRQSLMYTLLDGVLYRRPF
ncbi:hypothetical protein LIER_31186 [Lithospermum erythrorhizon]|uniref:Uncharacterized protein n=1 Tax=Lithospermum erythrorhizon TaxID=34254 RepID=A0AAV3RTD3_LITER